MRTKLMTCIAVAAATLALMPASSWAQDAEPAGEADAYSDLTARASEAYEAGDLPKAVELFKQAYALRPVSNILYNIGRIYEDLGDIDNAITHYDQFVVAPNVEQVARRDALDRLKTLREVQKLRDGEGEPQEIAEPTPTPQPTPEPKPKSSVAKTLGWTFLGVGGASLVGSGIFALLTQSQHAAFEDAETLEERRDAASSGSSLAVVADTMLVVGAISAVTGGVLLIVSSGGGEESARVRVSPLVGSHGWGLGLDLNF